MRRLAIALLALSAPAAQAAVEGPAERLADAGGRPDVTVRSDGTAWVAWEGSGATNLRMCRIDPGASGCAAGTERTGEGATGTTSRPFVLSLGGDRVVVVHGGCCPQRTYRFISDDGGATYSAGVDFASLVPADVALAGDTLQLVGDPASGTVGYQQAAVGAGSKVTQEATLEASAPATAYAVATDAGRPVAAWTTATDGFAARSPAGAPNASASWASVPLAGATGIRLAGPYATWVRAGARELATWSNGALGAGVPQPYAPAAAGEADLAVDASGGGHLVYTRAGSGDVCYASTGAGGAWRAPVLLARDSDTPTGVQVAATGPGAGRAVFADPGGVYTVPLSSTGLAPNSCGLAPGTMRITRVAGAANLRVALNPQGQDTTYRVEYGATGEYGTATADVAVPGSAGPVVATVALPGIAPGADYHARLVATNATGTTATEDATFHAPALLRAVRPAQLVAMAPRCRRHTARVVVGRRAGAVPVLAVVRVGGRSLTIGRKRLRDGEAMRVAVGRRGGRVSVAVRLADGRVLRRSRTYARC